MLTSLDSAAQTFLRGLTQIQQRSERAQRELTTGLRISTVSDDPDQIAGLWQTRSNLAQVQQIGTNLTRVKTEADTAEGVLQNAVLLVERAQTLGTQGANGTTSAQTRQDLANELGTILEQLVSAANTSVEGRFVFSGDSDQQAAYSLDLTQSSPVSLYQGSAATRQTQAADGSLFSVSKTAQEIFDNPSAQLNVFSAITNLRSALLNDDDAAIAASIGDVQGAGTYLNQQLAFYGSVQSRVARAIDFGSTYTTQLIAQLSGIQDADETKSITDLTQAQTQLQAALVSRAKLPRTSLFDFLG